MDTNELYPSCEKEKCCTTIVKNYYGCGCNQKEVDITDGIGGEGKSAYDIAVEHDFYGTEEEWLMSLKGKSAYEIAVEHDFSGTKEEWLTSLKSEPSLDIEEYGVECRTNIIRNGKPVYKMLIDCGKLPQGVTAGVIVSKEIPYSINNIQQIWIAYSSISDGDTTVQAPLTGVSAVNSPANYVQRTIIPQILQNKGVIAVLNTYGAILNNFSMDVIVHYTKTTDV